jgi:hypothetical protein
MIKITSALPLAALVFCLHVASAQAQLVRTCVSMAKGSDANSSSFCHCTTPCRTFATAAANTLADGEITVLDPGDYGGLMITRSLSINNDSEGEASITVSGGTTGIIVNAAPGAYVNLRGLTVQGVGFGGSTGLDFGSGLFLTITNCVFRNHTAQGILFRPAGSATLVMADSLVADNGGTGIDATGSAGGTKRLVLDRVRIVNNSGTGLNVAGGSFAGGSYTATISDSVAANNGSIGFNGNTGVSGSPVNMMIAGSVAANNGTGVRAIGGSSGPAVTLRISQMSITGNGTGWSQGTTGVVRSYGDNLIDGNGDAPEPTPTAITKK